MKNKKNKSNAGAIWSIVIFSFVIICSIFITEIMAAKDKEIENISFDRYKNELSGENEKLVLLTKNDCEKCDDMSIVLKDIKAEGATDVYSINVDDLSSKNLNALLESSDLIEEGVFPTVLHISAGGLIGSYKEDADYNDIIDFMYVLKPITVSQYIELAKEDVEHFVYIGRPTCSYCVQSLPWSKRISRDLDKDMYYIDIDEETEASLELLAETTEQIYKGSTPLFLITKNNKIVKYKEGAGSYSALSAFFNGTSAE